MKSFVFKSLPSRVVFGAGSLQRVTEEAEALGIKRPVLIATPSQYAALDVVRAAIGTDIAAVLDRPEMHTPVEVTERAMAVVQGSGADGIIAIGGGSAIGLSKAIALRTNLAQIVLPTTYAGSEVTPVLGETKDGVKTTQTNAKVLPETVIYDADLTVGMPVPLSVTSGFNAISHAVEALYAKERNPLISLAAVEAIKAMTEALPQLVENPRDPSVRAKAQYGAWLAGVCLGSVGMSLHHKLCHTLGGSYGLPHSELHTVLLPHTLAYNWPAAQVELAPLLPVLGPNPALGLFELASRLGAPMRLADLAMAEELINEASSRAVANPYWNPRPIERPQIERLISRAWHGEAPQSE